ncbi:hypothetical protein PMAYCL1PPCAC_15243 [Pristionchus mayeri]|uniref:Uncharacterized protein n=1 Tax=Pristionchus mayeri TaxID=1317129 RepID=A0AAN5CIH6_9BILA|nr:hypothetical protein PMAYCL1PPCAC_15243 [Pristionchus mayeri]
MQNFGLLITALLIVSSLSLKMTPEIGEEITNTIMVKKNEESESKQCILPSFLCFLRASNLVAAQKILKENTEADRNMAINKYMVDTCGSMKSCMVCPLDLA